MNETKEENIQKAIKESIDALENGYNIDIYFTNNKFEVYSYCGTNANGEYIFRITAEEYKENIELDCADYDGIEYADTESRIRAELEHYMEYDETISDTKSRMEEN